MGGALGCEQKTSVVKDVEWEQGPVPTSTMEVERSWSDDGLNGGGGALKRRVGIHTAFGPCTQQNVATNYWDEGDTRRSSLGGEGNNNLSLNMVSLRCLLHTQLSAKEVIDSLSLDS